METIKFKHDPTIEAYTAKSLVDGGMKRLIVERLRERISELSALEIEKEILKISEENISEILEKLASSEKYWKGIEKRYSEIFRQTTGFSLDLDKTVYISSAILGFADTKYGRIFVDCSQPQNFLNYLIPHELTHLFYRDAMASLNEIKGMSSALMESIDHLILFKSPISSLLHTSIKYKDRGFVRKNKEFMGKMEALWKKKTSFKDFIEKAIELESQTKEIEIC